MNITRRESIATFLTAKTRPELATLYHPGMEVQVNVAQGKGEAIAGEYNGHNWTGWTDGSQVWKPIRIPYNANSEPNYTDSPMKFDLAEHAEGIGMTGYDFENHRSVYLAYDFDAICGHSERHAKKLTDQELEAVRNLACSIPWVTVRQSTSGNGLHLYVFLDNITGIKNHTEHAAIARAVLGKMGALTGFDFNSKVDNCGSNIWIWHRKYDKAGGVEGPGLKLIRQGEMLRDIPMNWKDHLHVTSGTRKRQRPGFVEEKDIDPFEEMCGQHPKVALDAEHRKLIEYLDKSGGLFWWDADHHMLVAHTADLHKAHVALEMRGIFKTVSTGREAGGDQNSFSYPQRKGAWVVRRHTKGVAEADCWDVDGSGYARCYLNKEPDFKIASRSNEGVENEKGAFVFSQATQAIATAKVLGATIELPDYAQTRQAILKATKDGRLVFEMEKMNGDDPMKMKGWLDEKGKWKRVVGAQASMTPETELGNYDDVVRHLVTVGNEDWGWVINADGTWCKEPYNHVKLALGTFGVSPKDVGAVMGQLVVKRWTLVNKPFEPEYPGDRQWNKNAAQLAFAPATDVDHSKYPTWTAMLRHCGSGLDDVIGKSQWCKENGITCGGDYLKCWVASLFQAPLEHLPYLFFYGPQASGKTTFSEAVSMLMTRGVMRADAALINQSGFNAELENKVLCIVEETDLRFNKGTAYNRIKDWVTNDQILIHEKNKTPYTVINSTHWIHNSNDIEEAAIFPGDTRLVFCFVKELEKMILKSDFMRSLQKEAPDFLAAILAMEIPKSYDRHNVPALETEGKRRAQELNRSELDVFIQEKTFPVPGESISIGDFNEQFQAWLGEDRADAWSKIKVGKEMIRLGYPKGRSGSDGSNWYYGNISWTMDTVFPQRPKLVVNTREMLVSEGTS